MRIDGAPVELQPLASEAFIGGASSPCHSEAWLITVGHCDLNARLAKRLKCKVPQCDRGRRCSASALRRLADPVTEIAQFIGCRELVQPTAAYKLPA